MASESPKKSKAKAAETGTPEGDQVRRSISANKLKKLYREVQAGMNSAAEISGEARQKIGEAVKKDFLNAPAFNIVSRILRAALRDPIKAGILWSDIHKYADDLDLDKHIAESMFTEEETVEAEAAEEIGDAADNIEQFSDHRETA